MTIDELRAKFEARWEENYFYVHEKLASLKEYAWREWQAAHASRDAEVEALDDAIFQLSVRLGETREPDMDDMSWHTQLIARAQWMANEVEALKVEIEGLRKDADAYRTLISQVGAEQVVAASKKFGDSLGILRDSERYRALRFAYLAQSPKWADIISQTPVFNQVTFDEAIDAAMREGK